MRKMFLTISLLFVSLCILTSCKKTTKNITAQPTTTQNTTTVQNTTKAKEIDLTGYTLIYEKSGDLPLGVIDYYASEKGKWVLELNDSYLIEIELNSFEGDQKFIVSDEIYLYTIAQAGGVYIRANQEEIRTTKAYHLKEA